MGESYNISSPNFQHRYLLYGPFVGPTFNYLRKRRVAAQWYGSTAGCIFPHCTARNRDIDRPQWGRQNLSGQSGYRTGYAHQRPSDTPAKVAPGLYAATLALR